MRGTEFGRRGALGMAALALGSAALGRQARAAETFRIGMVVPMSGLQGGSYYGPQFESGLKLAVDQVNASGALPVKLSYVIEDGQGDPSVATKALDRLIYRENADIIVGEMLSNATLAMMPIVARQKIPLLVHSSNATSITEAHNPMVVRTAANTSELGADLATFVVKKQGLKNIAIVYQQNDFGREFYTAFKDQVQKEGGTIVLAEEVPPSVQDFSPVASRLAALKQLDAVIDDPALPQAAPLLRAAAEQNVKATWFGGHYLTTDFDKQAGVLANGVYLQTFFDVATPNPVGHAFVESYEKAFKREPEILSAEAFEAVLVIADAIKRGGTDPKKFLAALRATKGVAGPMGTVTLDANGQAIVGGEGKQIYYNRIENGKRVLVTS
jgi:branched-chain amino acid transport system substrate-binding protein